jgi:hypothetical protein
MKFRVKIHKVKDTEVFEVNADDIDLAKWEILKDFESTERLVVEAFEIPQSLLDQEK